MHPDQVLAADLARVRLGAGGVPEEPYLVVDLDRTPPSRVAELAAAPAGGRRGLIGVAAGRPADAVLPLLPAFTVTLVGHGGPATRPGPPAPWVVVPDPAAAAGAVLARVERAPRAAFALDGLLRLTAAVGAEDGVVAESLCYSMLLAGPEFAAWRASRPVREVAVPPEPVSLARAGDRLRIRLEHPQRRNAFSRALRAALIDALRLAEADPSVTEVEITGAGAAFSSGGDLDEFGLATDVSAAHAVRLEQSAGLAVHRLGDRVTAVVHGDCVGAGIEVPAFAARVLARPGASFRLPELDLGLVPGAGGTVGVTHRIGRWRTAWLVLSGQVLGLDDALAWGLVDDVTDDVTDTGSSAG